MSFFLVARSAQKLEAVRQDLLTRGASAVYMLAADLDETAAQEQVVAAAIESLGEIDGALLAYAIVGDQSQAEVNYEAAERILRTNFLSAVSYLIHHVAGQLFRTESPGHSRRHLVSSGRPRPQKQLRVRCIQGALNIFLDGVRTRIDRRGVQVLTVRPGFVETPMTAHLPQGPLVASPAKIAGGIERAIAKRKDVVYLPSFWALMMFVIRNIPQTVFKSSTCKGQVVAIRIDSLINVFCGHRDKAPEDHR